MTNWRPIETHDPARDPDICLVAFADGVVDVAEYSEHHDGGPDDFRRWETAYRTRAIGDDWPTHWKPMDEPPAPEEGR